MNKTNKNKSLPVQYVEAFLEFLGRPKTVFDLKDRTKAIIFFGIVIIILQKVVEILFD